MQPPSSFSPPPSSTHSARMAVSDSSCSNVQSTSELVQTSPPLPRPRPKYFDPPHRFSGASSSSAPSSSSSTPNLASPLLRGQTMPVRGAVNSAYSAFSVDSPYLDAGRPLSLGYEYTLSADLSTWASEYTPDYKEEDDNIHQPDAGEKKAKWDTIERDGHYLSWRGFVNLGTLIVLTVGLVVLLAGYPMIYYFTRNEPGTLGAFNLGGTNGSGQVPLLHGRFTLVDPNTPEDAHTRPSPSDPSKNLELVFSDEFNTPNRTFYPGDDPFWEAVDLHYWATNNLEWYDPASITTTDGSLVITLQQKQTHDLNYQGGMLTTWNKFCFTGGYVEARVQLPGVSNIQGLWPAVWMMGNLGRAGYGASLEGLWPYTYDECDVGTVKNQSINGQPPAAMVNGDKGKGGVLSYLPGQRLSRCTCAGEDHPGPKHSDGSFVGRAAPEIDMFEAQVTDNAAGVTVPGTLTGQVSQSAQWAPFNAGYLWQNTSDNGIITDPSRSLLNTFMGSATQQATSVVTNTNTQCYEYPDPNFVPLPVEGAQLPQQIPGAPAAGSGCYDVYGVEYKPGFDDAYISWVSSSQLSWTIKAAGLGPDPETQIGARPVPQEPMYLIANLGMSYNFGDIDLTHIPFPVHLRIDYIRVYQPSNARNVGCDPPDFPTAKYIEKHIEAYTNPNLTTWVDDYHQPWPKNKFLGEC